MHLLDQGNDRAWTTFDRGLTDFRRYHHLVSEHDIALDKIEIEILQVGQVYNVKEKWCEKYAERFLVALQLVCFYIHVRCFLELFTSFFDLPCFAPV